MKTNNKFKINLPSIPGKSIRLKVQDIKKKGFLSREQRFSEPKSNLVPQFIETFQNLHQQKYQSKDNDEDKQTQQTRSTFKQKKHQQPQFRYVMPQYKNTLVELLQREERQMRLRQRQPFKLHKDIEVKKVKKVNSTIERVQRNKQLQKQRKMAMQNYSLLERQMQQSQKKEKSQHKIKPSAVFKNQPRVKMYKRQELSKSEIPGPGYYLIANQNEQKEEENMKDKNQIQKFEKQQKIQNLKKQTKKIFQKHNIITQQIIEQEQEKKPVQPSYMFQRDDRDRYGEQIFPIVLKLNVPGPGAYNIGDTIEDKAKRVIILQQQRKLLKDWFNQ